MRAVPGRATRRRVAGWPGHSSYPTYPRAMSPAVPAGVRTVSSRMVRFKLAFT
jgi:hypothetical protein